MRSIIYIILILLSISCKENNSKREKYNAIIETVEDSDYSITESADTSGSSWIEGADYYGDKEKGEFIMQANGEKYIFKNLPYSVWLNFKSANSKGKYYHQNIKGRYQYILK